MHADLLGFEPGLTDSKLWMLTTTPRRRCQGVEFWIKSKEEDFVVGERTRAKISGRQVGVMWGRDEWIRDLERGGRGWECGLGGG